MTSANFACFSTASWRRGISESSDCLTYDVSGLEGFGVSLCGQFVWKETVMQTIVFYVINCWELFQTKRKRVQDAQNLSTVSQNLRLLGSGAQKEWVFCNGVINNDGVRQRLITLEARSKPLNSAGHSWSKIVICLEKNIDTKWNIVCCNIN